MKPLSKHRRLAWILAVAALAPGCMTSPQASQPAAPDIACTTVPIAGAPAAGTSGQHARPGWLSVPGGLFGVAARSPGSALAVGWTGPAPTARIPSTRALVARWNGAAWKTLSSQSLPPDAYLTAVALFPGGAWAVGGKGIADYGQVSFPLMVRVSGSTVRQVPIPRTGTGGGLGDVAATSATDAWALGGGHGTGRVAAPPTRPRRLGGLLWQES